VIKNSCEQNLSLLKTFVPVKPKESGVLVISYELLRMKIDILKRCLNIRLLIMDEGHRLKNCYGSQTMSSLLLIQCSARLLLTGTPIQNILSEFYTLANFVYPGVFSDLSTFRQEYERPIEKATEKSATNYDKELAKWKTQELASIINQFVIRRLQKDVLKCLIPSRHEFLLFFKPSIKQCEKYKELTCQANKSLSYDDSLLLLSKLRKICCHPYLLEENNDISHDQSIVVNLSGKLSVLDTLLSSIKNKTYNSSTCKCDKVVIVSNYTSSLTMIEDSIIKPREYPFLRFDGTLDNVKRQSHVDSFNRSCSQHSFILLLSAKAGGCGLNLIGAN